MTSLLRNVQSKGTLESLTGGGIDVILSVEAWTLVDSVDPGLREPVNKCGQYSLQIKGAEVSIFKAPTNVSFFSRHNEICTLELGKDISSVEMSNDSLSLLAFGLYQTNKTKALFNKHMGIGALQVGEFTNKSSIVFKTSKKISGRNEQSLRQMNDLFKAGRISICYLDEVALGARWGRFMSGCRDSQQANSFIQNVRCQSDLMEVDGCRTDTEKRGQRRPPELNLISRAKRGRTAAPSPRTGKWKDESFSSVSASKSHCFSPKGLAAENGITTRTNQPRPGTTSHITLHKSLQTESNHILPIRTWVSGTQIIESFSSETSELQYWFRVRGSNISILNGSPPLGTLLFEFELNLDIISVELPQTHTVAAALPLIVLTLCETDRTALFIKKNKTFDRKRPIIAIKLSPSHTRWSLASYREFESLITASKVDILFLNAPSIHTRWQTLQRSEGSQAEMGNISIPSLNPLKGRPKPRPTYVGAEDEAYSESNVQRRLTLDVNDYNNAISEKVLQAELQKPPTVKEDITRTKKSSYGGLGAIDHLGNDEEGIVGTEERTSTALIIDPELPSSGTRSTSDFLNRNHKEIKEMLQQALDLLDSGCIEPGLL